MTIIMREVTFKAALSVLTLLTMTQAHPLTSETTATSPAEETPPRGEPSHLLFYLMVEKELVPQTKALAARALDILQNTCRTLYNRTSECMKETDKLPGIPALGDFPSDGALEREGSRMFSKHLLKDVHRTLLKLQMLLEEESEERFEPLTQLISDMDSTRQQLHDQMNQFYTINLRDRDEFTKVTKSKKRYMTRSRDGEDCRGDKDDEDGDGDDDDDYEYDERADCLTEDDYRLKLMYTAYRKLLRVHHVLGYTVRLSWLALEEDAWP
ncbi:uncharacterized protein LOC143294348 isoform X2 [Babylonia areolata]|uniref:uncharacterized protein LOC143294348 isoform X1 n=1 Tax=Babylonia areolata TaxID=304850 RepID=UPI003FD6AAC7